MRYLVWGGAGFLGSHLCEALLAEGADVVCADNLSTGSRRNLLDFESNPRFRFIRADVSEPLDLPGPVDVIYHLASPASMPAIRRDPLACISANTVGTMMVLRAAALHGARVVLASTSEVYGDPEVSPQVETYRGNVNTVGPRSCYDEAKRMMETIAYEHWVTGVDVRIIRVFNTYGPRLPSGDGRIIPRFFRNALRGDPLPIFGDGSATRSLCYVSDLIRGFVAMGAVPRGAHLRVCNLGSPDELSVLDIAQRVLRVTGSTSDIRFEDAREDDPTQRRPDIARAGLELGWTPTVSLEDGLARCASYFSEEATRGFVDY